MANEGLGQSISELQSLIGHRRLASGDRDGGMRMIHAARNSEVTEHWVTHGWYAPGQSLAFGAPQTGRGWHDAQRGFKLP